MSRIVTVTNQGKKATLAEMRAAIEGLKALSVAGGVQSRPTLDHWIEVLERAHIVVWIEFSPMPLSEQWIISEDDPIAELPF